ncbi:hypothetical protein KK062_26400 [Fulvivirgaceae bacterium PWU5]|uniref:Uncharacterized protein n=1 Tax=Dawidia cretensis TaxID=2782350 RepID=A0AAP2E2B8_9BACT|nr:hypothetical protein [Dawidia cretensis]MBT1711800.1 hypothetical protein [Dawidia cretensis]
MKTKYWLLYFILVAFVSGCSDEQQPTKPGNVRFTINPATDPRGRISASLPEGASLYVSIQEAGGGDVYTLEHVTLLKMGDAYISEPLSLPPGHYDLTDFLVVNVADEVIYATPKEGSDMAGWVDDPLPLAFGVNDNAITGLSVQVVSTSAYPPAAFGYLTFQVGIVPGTSFRLAVFKPTPTGFIFSPAQVYILDGADTIYRQHVSAAPEAILFDGDLTRTYTLVVIQASYKKYTETFILGDLLASLAGGPHTVWLEPAFTFRLTYHEVSFQLQGDIDTLYIDWGDGTQEIITQHASEGDPEHVYESRVSHFVSISGATLNKIERVAFVYDLGSTSEISLEYLTGLKDFVATFAHTPPTVDFSHNPALERIEVAVSDIVELDLSHNPKVREVSIFGNFDFSVPSLNAMIHHLYTTAVHYNHIHGAFVAHSFPVSMTTFIGPPSPEAMDELRILRDYYDWYIDPVNF